MLVGGGTLAACWRLVVGLCVPTPNGVPNFLPWLLARENIHQKCTNARLEKIKLLTSSSLALAREVGRRAEVGRRTMPRLPMPMLYKPKWSKPSGSEIDPDAPELSQLEEIPPAQRAYLDTPVLVIFSQRFPWLLSLMLFQSVSGWVIEHFQGLIEKHVILAAFLTMLVGGGGNSSGQTVAELVKRLSTGELTPAHLPQVLAKEVAVGSLLAVGLAVGAYPRVRLLSSHATDLDAVAAQRVEKCRLGAAAGYRPPGDALR